MPEKPVSDDPMVSVSTMLGNVSRYCCLTEDEKIAAPLLSARRVEPSYAPDSYASIIGRAIASPVMAMTLTFSCSTSRHTSCASNFGISTTVLAVNSAPSAAHCAAPCIIGATGNRTSGPPSAPSRASFHSSSTGSLVMKSMPPPSTRHTSSWRHTTPLGMPVVPPV
jgi:hypothetical protein